MCCPSPHPSGTIGRDKANASTHCCFYRQKQTNIDIPHATEVHDSCWSFCVSLILRCDFFPVNGCTASNLVYSLSMIENITQNKKSHPQYFCRWRVYHTLICLTNVEPSSNLVDKQTLFLFGDPIRNQFACCHREDPRFNVCITDAR